MHNAQLRSAEGQARRSRMGWLGAAVTYGSAEANEGPAWNGSGEREKTRVGTAVRDGEKHVWGYHQESETRSRVAKSNLKGRLLLRAPSMLRRLDAARRRIEIMKK